MKNIIPVDTTREDFPGTPALKCVECEEEIRERYSAYLCDESRLSGGKADVVAFAHSEHQVAEMLRKATASGTSVTISAARTGIVGGAVPAGGILLSLEAMNRFLGARWDEAAACWYVRVQPGLSIEGLAAILENKRFEDAFAFSDGSARESLKRFAEESPQWFYPVDPTEKSAHIGGTVATNASGARSFRYGQTREYVKALRVVLADGSVLSLKRGDHVSNGEGFGVGSDGRFIPVPDYVMPKVKNAAGYFVRRPMDFIDFFIGSEGTLGVITEIELELRRKPEWILSAVAFFPSEAAAVGFVKSTRDKSGNPDKTVSPSALEYFDSYSLNLLRDKRDHEAAGSSIPPFSDYFHSAVYFEQAGKEEDMESIISAYADVLAEFGSSIDETWAGMTDKERGDMAAFRHALPEVINTLIGQRQKALPQLHKVGTDFAVPDDRLEEMLAFHHLLLNEAGFEYAIFGHIGESHLHVNILPRNEEELKKAKELYMRFAQKAVALGGTVSGEHGIGKLKKPFLSVMYSREAIEEMRKVKAAFDPKHVLNPGNIF